LFTHLQGAWDVICLTCLLIYFIMCAFYDLAWLYMTWQPYVAMHIWQNCQHPGSHFLILVAIMSSQSIEESLVASDWMHKDSIGQTMNQVMTSFQQQFGKPCLCWTTLSVWEKVCLCRGIWRILLGAVDRYPERWPVLWLPFPLNDHHTSPCGNDQRNMEYYIWPRLATRGTWWWGHFGHCNWTQQ